MLRVVEVDECDLIPGDTLVELVPGVGVGDVMSGGEDVACVDAESDSLAIFLFKCIGELEEVEHIAEHFGALS